MTQVLSAAAVSLPSAASIMLFWVLTADCAPSAALSKQQPDVLHRCHGARQHCSIHQPQVGVTLQSKTMRRAPLVAARAPWYVVYKGASIQAKQAYKLGTLRGFRVVTELRLLQGWLLPVPSTATANTRHGSVGELVAVASSWLSWLSEITFARKHGVGSHRCAKLRSDPQPAITANPGLHHAVL